MGGVWKVVGIDRVLRRQPLDWVMGFTRPTLCCARVRNSKRVIIRRAICKQCLTNAGNRAGLHKQVAHRQQIQVWLAGLYICIYILYVYGDYVHLCTAKRYLPACTLALNGVIKKKLQRKRLSAARGVRVTYLRLFVTTRHPGFVRANARCCRTPAYFCVGHLVLLTKLSVLLSYMNHALVKMNLDCPYRTGYASLWSETAS